MTQLAKTVIALKSNVKPLYLVLIEWYLLPTTSLSMVVLKKYGLPILYTLKVKLTTAVANLEFYKRRYTR